MQKISFNLKKLISKTLLAKGLMLLVCFGLLWNFQGNFSAKIETEKNLAKNFSDENSEKENFESQDLTLSFETKNYTILKFLSGKNFYQTPLPTSGFTLSISTPPPNLSSSHFYSSLLS